jgi:hypothetical protein
LEFRQQQNTTTRKAEDSMSDTNPRYTLVTDGSIKAGDEHMLKVDLINGGTIWGKTTTTSVGRSVGAYPEFMFRRLQVKPITMAFLIRSNNVMVYPGQKIVIGCETVDDHKVQAMMATYLGKNETVNNETKKTTNS